MLYEHSALPTNVEPEARLFTTINEAGFVQVSDGVQHFFLDTVSGGQSELFAKSIVQVSELTEEVLTLIMPKILFQVRSPHDLEVFAEQFAAHLGVCDVTPELHIELDFTWSMKEEHIVELGRFEEIEQPHGRGFMGSYTAEWLSMVALLPESAHVHLIFSKFWRDFRELRGLSTKFGLCKRVVEFQFLTKGLSDVEMHFYKAQTMAAVKNVEVTEQSNISSNRREALVKLGCRGFNQVRHRLNA